MAGMTLDSGALIALERADRRIWVHLKEAASRKLRRTVSTAVLAEVWRGGARSARLAQFLGTCSVEPVSESLARVAGEALAVVKRGDTIDALVMASAAQRGDTVITSDPDDLGRLQTCFPNVRIVSL
jgi:predicted nucleic acid-binding protein